MLPGTPKIDITDGHNKACAPTQSFETERDREFNSTVANTSVSTELIKDQWYKLFTTYSADGSGTVIESL